MYVNYGSQNKTEYIPATYKTSNKPVKKNSTHLTNETISRPTAGKLHTCKNGQS